MGLLTWLRRLGPQEAGPKARPERRSVRVHADEDDRSLRLRERLAEDPNDVEAFSELAEIVRTHSQELPVADPLTAAASEQAPGTDHAVWALAEELAGQPRAWYPLVELARLSLTEDHEGALRRLGSACERELTGVALTEALTMLRAAGHAHDAVAFGVGRWDPASQVPEAGYQVIRAALDADRVGEARRLLDALAAVPSSAEQVRRLAPLVAAAESAP